MRRTWTLVGVGGIMAYSLAGAMLMNDWALTAATGLSLTETITQLAKAGEPYSPIPGVIFAVIGLFLAAIWAYWRLSKSIKLPRWDSLTSWAGIIAFGAPAYFFASFANMNSVGDAFYNWDYEAAYMLELPLYISSGAAVLIAAVTLLTRRVQRAS